MKEFSEAVCTEIIEELEQNRNSTRSVRDKYIELKKLLDRLTKSLTEEESIQFPSLFSRIVFLKQKYDIPNMLEWQLQNIRVRSNSLIKDPTLLIRENQFTMSIKSIISLLSYIYKNEDKDNSETFEGQIPKDEVLETQNNKDYKRIQVLDIDRERKIIRAISSDNEEDVISVKYDVPNINDEFTSTLDLVWINAQINIIDYKIDSYGIYIPKLFVIEPDYLIDASALAECFQTYGHSHILYYKRKFEQISNSQHILLGNLANYFLDELIYSENIEKEEFIEKFTSAFKDKPFEFSACKEIRNTSDFKTFMSKASTQFNNIKRVITKDLKENNIDINSSILEPSFFSEKYGFQGRLDLLEYKEGSNKLNIIELKSGKTPFPYDDPSRISINHQVQATIYKLIVESVFNSKKNKISTAIMYSSSENYGENLRYVAHFQKLEKQIIDVRNKIILTEHTIYIEDDNVVENLFNNISNPNSYGIRIPSYLEDEINTFDKWFKSLNNLEKNYLFRYINFISRELYIQKVGGESYDSFNSIASLWNSEFNERKESFELISDLEIEKIDDSNSDLKIYFKRNNSEEFANFREGELCILYPKDNTDDSVLTNQIMKGALASISSNNICLRFRYKQKNKDYFQRYKYWVIEHDKLDHAYTNMYKSLFSFFKSPIEKRNIVLGLKEPASKYIIENKHLTNDPKINKQLIIIEKAIKAEDYFLIVGPPGTGKTSIYAKSLIKHYYKNTEDNILIIAYTNRAVDELCESICNSFNSDNQECTEYIRIGTELSCDPKYRHRLLQNISRDVQNRDQLLNIIRQKRIIVGTLSSIVGKPELFDIKHFKVSIIDEASQILEPQIIGILPKVDKFIMIGDHKQLSTITLQNKFHSTVNDKELNIIKLYDCSESLFERLYRLCNDNNWSNAFDTLEYQGRMHTEIAEFPNKYFYNSILKPASEWQSEKLSLINRYTENPLYNICCKNRLHFFDVKDDNLSANDKVNIAEAELTSKLCETIYNIYKDNNKDFLSDKTIGIITPYRNQIALIKHKLRETNIEDFENIMVDTVERFQGSQRDIIIVSFDINKTYQLNYFSNLNSEKTVDRKLNVLLTRARQQLFLIGNKEILSTNRIYKELINSII